MRFGKTGDGPKTVVPNVEWSLQYVLELSVIGRGWSIKMRFAVVSVVISLSALAAPAQPVQTSNAAPKPSPRMRLATSIRLDRDVVKIGQDLIVFVDEKNISDRPLSVWYEYKNPRVPEMDFRTFVRDESGALAPLTKFGRKAMTGEDEPGQITVETGGGRLIDLPPGQTRTRDIALKDLYELGKPGRYTVQLEIPDEKGNIIAKTNIQTFTVVR